MLSRTAFVRTSVRLPFLRVTQVAWIAAGCPLPLPAPVRAGAPDLHGLAVQPPPPSGPAHPASSNSRALPSRHRMLLELRREHLQRLSYNFNYDRSEYENIYSRDLCSP